jgi:putative tricarboxylic transport membrane protein
LAPAVVVLCFFGAFAVRNFMTDILITLAFGLVGFVLYKCKWPLPCLVLGFVLGDILESNFHRTLIIGHGSLAPFVTRPVPLLLLVACVLFLCWPYVTAMIFPRRRNGGILRAGLDEEVER